MKIPSHHLHQLQGHLPQLMLDQECSIHDHLLQVDHQHRPQHLDHQLHQGLPPQLMMDQEFSIHGHLLQVDHQHPPQHLDHQLQDHQLQDHQPHHLDKEDSIHHPQHQVVGAGVQDQQITEQ